MKALLAVIGAGALSGLLLALSLPPIGVGWLGSICLVPLLAAVAGKGLLRGFVGGIMVPFAAAAVVQSGMFYRVTPDLGSANWLYTGFGFFGFGIAVVACVAAETKATGWRRVAMLAALAIVLELALFPILPAHLALTQSRQAGMLLLASAGGIWIVSLLLWAANAAIGEAVRGEDRRPSLILAGVVALTYGVGYIPRAEGESLTKVSAVQTQATDPATLKKWNAQAGREGASLAVWPEFSGLEIVPRGDTADLRALSSELGQPPFVTTFRDDYQPLPHNVAALFDRGVESARYFKRKVFGGESNMHTPGTKAVRVPWPGHPPLALGICYDSCYPRMMADSAAFSETCLIALPTIDPDATNCFVAAVHAAFTPFRAAESGIAIVRADGTAYSQIVDNTGHIVAELGPRKEGVLTAAVSTTRRWTLYSILGDWVLYLCATYLAAVVLAGFVAEDRKGRIREK